MQNLKQKLSTAVNHPNLLGRKINQYYYKFKNYKGEGLNKAGIDVFSKDWDNLILLDACRFDIFKDNVDLPGELYQVQSKGARTPEFLEGNFSGRDLTDTIYINANPMVHNRSSDFQLNMYEIYDLWETSWDEETGTVLPEVVMNKAISVSEEFPDKRLFIHFIQPHYPFISSDKEFHKDPGKSSVDDNIWRKLERNELEVDTEHIWSLYIENLTRTIPSVKSLMLNLKGKTVVTSDHGNMFGERSWPIPHKEWGHPPGIFTEELVSVPWLEYTNGERKEIKKESPPGTEKHHNSNAVEERLESLGYKT